MAYQDHNPNPYEEDMLREDNDDSYEGQWLSDELDTGRLGCDDKNYDNEWNDSWLDEVEDEYELEDLKGLEIANRYKMFVNELYDEKENL